MKDEYDDGNSTRLQMIRYPRLVGELDHLSCVLRSVRNRHSDEDVRLAATVQAFVVGVDLMQKCRPVLPCWAYELPEISNIQGQLSESGIDHADLKTYLGIGRDKMSRNQREAIEHIFRCVLDPQLSRIGRYRGPGLEYILFKRRIINPNDRLVVAWDEEVRLLRDDLSNPERKHKHLSNILSHTTPNTLNLVEDMVAHITNHPESQLISDSLSQAEAYPHIGKRFFNTGTLDLHPHRHGVDNDHNTRVASAIHHERARVEHNLVSMLIHDGLKLEKGALTDSRPSTSMRTVIEIILNSVTQLSPSALRVVLRYAHAATIGVDDLGGRSGQDQNQQTHDVWSCSIGGDEDAAPMIEGCILDKLLKLQQLERLYVAGTIRSVPDLWCVATFHSQAAENAYNKAGQPLDPARHIYHARLMIERLHAFVTTYFPDVAHRCRWIEFPPYAAAGSARALFAAVWQRLPARATLGARFAAFRGGVYKSTYDRIATLFAASDGDCGTYPVRHVFSNGLAAYYQGKNIRILRWAPMNTEPLFWIVARMAYMEMLRNPTALCDDVVSAYMARGTHEERIILPTLLHDIAFQQSRLNDVRNLCGQIGIAAPALYYRRAGEPTPGELARGGIALLTQLAIDADRERQRRLWQMCALYKRLEELPGTKPYSTFLAGWAERSYSGLVPPDAIESQVERTRSYVIRDAVARSMLNFWLS